jgi:hypothetical protein
MFSFFTKRLPKYKTQEINRDYILNNINNIVSPKEQEEEPKSKIPDYNKIINYLSHDYKHFCHIDNKKYITSILLNNLTNDFEFPYTIKDINDLSFNTLNFINIDVINDKKYTDIIDNIINVLNIQHIQYNKQDLIKFYNEWLLNTETINYTEERIVEDFIKAYINYIKKYKLLFNTKKLYNNQVKNETLYNNISNSVFYEDNLTETFSISNNKKHLKHFNNTYFNQKPSERYTFNYKIKRTNI